MNDKKKKIQTAKKQKEKEKRREYMRKYYRRKKDGKVKKPNTKILPTFTIKRGSFIVKFD